MTYDSLHEILYNNVVIFLRSNPSSILGLAFLSNSVILLSAMIYGYMFADNLIINAEMIY